MDTQTKTAMQREAELQRQINALYRRKGEIEVALQYEHVAQERAGAKRTSLIADLPGADDAMTGYTHAEVDKLDETLRLSVRVAQGLNSSHDRVVNEIASLNVELAEVTQIVGEKKRIEGLNALRIQLQKAREAAEGAMAAAREALAALNIAAARGIEEFGVPAQNLVTPVLEEFRHQQFNPESYGWRLSSPSFANLRFVVAPMVKQSTPR